MNTLSSSRPAPARSTFLTATERDFGHPIRDLLDAEAYRALGAKNTTPGASDEETIDWALQASVCKVADRATESHRLLILHWVREGEEAARLRAETPFEMPDAATVVLLERAWTLLSPAHRTGSWKGPVRLRLRLPMIADLAREGLTPAVLARACRFYTSTPLRFVPANVDDALLLEADGYQKGPAGDH